jgi:hypothetical protein
MTSTESHGGPESRSRRAALRTIGAGVGAFAVWPALSDAAVEAFLSIQRSQAAPKPRFLSAAQYATTDALAETLIPSDSHSPGARAARVADYIDLLLSESDAGAKQAWTDGLAALDTASHEHAGLPFAGATAAQQIEVLTPPSRNEANPQTPLEKFFKASKEATIRGYYTSEIGLLKDLQYKGNQFLGEFVGCTHLEHGFVPPRE